MNRHILMSAILSGRFPHTRGDEPIIVVLDLRIRAGFPHTRGDEPRVGQTKYDVLTSFPHTRGDEPPRSLIAMKKKSVFPTPVGMNRR